MSQWTHVAGIVRLDNMGSLVRMPVSARNEKVEEAVVRALGNTCVYGDSSETWNSCTVPCGSEGSLQYKVYPNTNKDSRSLSWGYVAIWGDLRGFDVGDLPTIYDWLEKSLVELEKPGRFRILEKMTAQQKAGYLLSVFVIREAVMCVEVKGEPKVVLLWDGGQQKIIRAQDYIPL